MDKLVFEILRHMRAMWRYRRLGLFTAWIVAIVATIGVFMVPKKYEASARVFVNTDSILKPLMVGMTVQPDNSERVAMLSRLVISRPNVEQLIKETGLDAKAKTAEKRERLLDDVMNRLSIESAGEKINIYLIKFRDTQPERAQHMVELLVSKFIDSSKGGRTTDTEAAKQFLDEQADAYEKKLQDAENRLKDFKLKNMVGISPGEGKDYVTQMQAVSEQLSQAQLQLREAENSRDAYRRGLAAEDITTAPTVATNAAGESIADIDARIDSMKRNLDSLLQRYTENHPDVVGTRRVINELYEQRKHLVEQYRKSGTPLTQPATTGPRASEQLKVSLAQAEASVASLRARVAEYSARYNQLRDAARRMPEYEAQLAQLTRDYQINKKNYDDLAARRESASIASDMQSVSGVADFRLIDPPRVSPTAVSTARSLMLGAALLAALSAGIGLMFLAKEIRARFYDRSQIGQVTGLPILGVISVVPNEEREREKKKQLRRFYQTAGALFGVYVVVVIAGVLLTKQPVV
jgi:polysaccharide chain length determinant protein (PEP-CTERM system associated)